MFFCSNYVKAEKLKERHQINSEIITGLYDIKTKELLGYFILYPLNKEATKDILELRVVNGKGIKNHHIAGNFKEAKSIYQLIATGRDFY